MYRYIYIVCIYIYIYIMTYIYIYIYIKRQVRVRARRAEERHDVLIVVGQYNKIQYYEITYHTTQVYIVKHKYT